MNMGMKRYPSPSDHTGLSVMTLGHLVPRVRETPSPPNNSARITEVTNGTTIPSTSSAAGASASRTGTGWNYGTAPGVTTNGDLPMRAASPIIPPASPPSLSSTDPRQIVNLDHTSPTQPPPPPRSARPPTSTSPTVPTSPSTSTGSSKKGNTLRVRRSTYVPGWAVPPRVLLVEDDLVSRRLSSKFLQVSGCTIDVAVDGVGAVNKMNLEKYDLVLMVSFLSQFTLGRKA